MTTDATVHHLDDLPLDHPCAGIARRRLVGAQAMLSLVTLERGTVVPVHAHPNEQIALVRSGLMRFTLPRADGTTSTVDLGPDEVLMLPANAPHGAEALERSVVLDIFAPPSARTGIDEPSS